MESQSPLLSQERHQRSHQALSITFLRLPFPLTTAMRTGRFLSTLRPGVRTATGFLRPTSGTGPTLATPTPPPSCITATAIYTGVTEVISAEVTAATITEDTAVTTGDTEVITTGDTVVINTRVTAVIPNSKK